MSVYDSPLEYLISCCENLRKLPERTDLPDYLKTCHEGQWHTRIRGMSTRLKAAADNFSKEELKQYIIRFEEYRACSFYIDDLLNYMSKLLAEKTA